MLIQYEPHFVPLLSLLGLLNQVIVNLTKVTAIHFIRSHRFLPVFQEVFLENLTKDNLNDAFLETSYFIFAHILQSHMHRL